MDRRVPPGLDWISEIKPWIAGMALSFLYSMSFFTRYFSAREQLYAALPGGRKELLPGAVMVPFRVLAKDALWLFPLLAAAAFTVFAALHYMTFFRGSRSIWLMRRLPDAGELPRRCFTLPLILAAATLIFAGILALLFYAVYFFCTPAGCLP